jgi:uncharacterized protein (DUF305 family)
MRHSRLFSSSFVLSVGILVAACSDAPSSPTSPSVQTPLEVQNSEVAGGVNGGASAPAPSPAAANYEQRFMMSMIDHHQMAIEMAEVCLAKAVHAELRQMCEQIIAAQSQEIEQMQTWLSDWYGVDYEPQMKPGDRQMLERLASSSGAEFEIAFMEMTIKHHERAIREGEQCLKKAYHAELIELCHDIIEAQSAEIAQLEAWLCQWYGRC